MSEPRTAAERLVLLGVVLFALAALAWVLTFAPPGTMTTVSLAGMTSLALAALGAVALLGALLLNNRLYGLAVILVLVGLIGWMASRPQQEVNDPLPPTVRTAPSR